MPDQTVIEKKEVQGASIQTTTSNMKPGYKTTEFWITIVSVITSTATGLSGIVEPKFAAILGAIATVGYAISRGLAKQGS